MGRGTAVIAQEEMSQSGRPKPNRLITLIKRIFTDQRAAGTKKENVLGSVSDRTKRIVVIPEEPGKRSTDMSAIRR
jgi:hypothetical protein